MGKGWFKKNVGWLVAFILYKPAAAIVYAAAFQLAGTNVFQDDGTGFIAVLTGLILMVLALFAMPALMRFVTPLVGAMSAGAGGALGVAIGNRFLHPAPSQQHCRDQSQPCCLHLGSPARFISRLIAARFRLVQRG